MADTSALEEATRYSFKPEDLAEAAARVGRYYPSDYREHLTLASHDTMRNFARGYGDDNPLYDDEYYGRATRWGGQIAPPLIVHIMNKPMRGDPGPKRVPFRGIHLFISGTTTDWYQPVREGDTLFRFGGTETSEMKESAFAGSSLIEKWLLVHVNQRAEVVAISRTTRILTERKAAREREKYAKLEPAQYTDEDIARHDAIYEAETVRGAEQRSWEDRRSAAAARQGSVRGDGLHPVSRRRLRLSLSAGHGTRRL
jgi:acyl dehydratase